jgi:Protein of unknown function (DUF1236)
MRTLRLAVIAATLAIPAAAYAQNYQDNTQTNNPAGTMGGAIGGAAAGAAVGGPVGAVVGFGLGSIMGSQLTPRPSQPYGGPVAVGQRLPRDVAIYPVPHHPRYRYAVVNDERVIVNPRTRVIERVIP